MTTSEEYNDKLTGSNDGRADPVRDALVKAISQLEKVHDDAFKQAIGHGLCTSDGRAFSCTELNRCSDVAIELRAALTAWGNRK